MIMEEVKIMIIIGVTLAVVLILGAFYVYFGKEQEKKIKVEQVKSTQICVFYQCEMEGIKEIQLAGTGCDGNSDYKVRQAIERIELSESTEVKLYA